MGGREFTEVTRKQSPDDVKTVALADELDRLQDRMASLRWLRGQSSDEKHEGVVQRVKLGIV